MNFCELLLKLNKLVWISVSPSGQSTVEKSFASFSVTSESDAGLKYRPRLTDDIRLRRHVHHFYPGEFPDRDESSLATPKFNAEIVGQLVETSTHRGCVPLPASSILLLTLNYSDNKP